MKAFKKLAAIVLAGVMALAVLTGCSDSDKTTFHKQLTDALSNAKVTAEYNTADVAKAEKIAQLWDSYAAEIKSIEKKQSEGKYDTQKDYQKARAAAIGKVVDAATLVGGEQIGFVTVQEKDADTIASIVSTLKANGATKYGYSNSHTKAAFEKDVRGTFTEGEFIVLVYEK